MSRFVVTGCAGFIGSHLTDALLGAGHEVVGIDAFSDYYGRAQKERNIAGARASGGFRLVEADLTSEPLQPLLEDADGVFHLAAQPGVRGSWGTAFATYLEHNVLATQRVIDAAAASGVRVLLASSSSIYGNALGYPTTEDARADPISPYGVTKLACEHLLAAYAAERDLDFVALRYFTVYGPRQRPDMAFSRIVGALEGRGTFKVMGTGAQSRDATYVGDAVAASIVAFERAPRGAVYNVGGGSEATLLEVIALAAQIAGRPVPAEMGAPAKGDVLRTRADTSRLRAATGWAPSVTLEEGLAAQIEATLARPIPVSGMGSPSPLAAG